MSETTIGAIPCPAIKTPAPPGSFSLADGTVLYPSLQKAEAAGLLTAAGALPPAPKKFSQAGYGERYLDRSGQQANCTLTAVADFQFAGLIVVFAVMVGLSFIWSILSRLLNAPEDAVFSDGETARSAVATGMHPGLTDQELVVLLTAAASEVLGASVRVDRFRPLADASSTWAAQGRMDLHSHRLK